MGQSPQLSLDLGEVCLLHIGFQVALPCVSGTTSLSFPLGVPGVSLPCDVGNRHVESMTYLFSIFAGLLYLQIVLSYVARVLVDFFLLASDSEDFFLMLVLVNI